LRSDCRFYLTRPGRDR